jgi:hypothetical protein
MVKAIPITRTPTVLVMKALVELPEVFETTTHTKYAV